METISIIWLSFIVMIISLYVFILNAIKPDKCPKCGTRMKYESRMDGDKVVDAQICPHCGYEEILNEES